MTALSIQWAIDRAYGCEIAGQQLQSVRVESTDCS